MAEEEAGPSPRTRRDSVRNRDSDPEFNRPQLDRADRKSLAGMSESVKAILAPLLGGKKSHSQVQVDMGRQSGSVYETVDTGSTAMQRYSTVEISAAAEAPSPSSNATQEGTSTDTINTQRWSTSRVPDVLELPPRTGSPIDPAYARVDTFLPATKPKMKGYDEYITETAPILRARMDSILGDKSHEAGFERKLPGGGMQLPVLEPAESSSSDRVKDTVTGQVPGLGTYSGKTTLDENPHTSETGGGRIYRDVAKEPGVEESSVQGPNSNESEDTVRDAVRDTVIAAEVKRDEGEDAPSAALVRDSEGKLPLLHPTSSRLASARRNTMP